MDGRDQRNVGTKDLPRFNGRVIDASFVGTSRKGGITRDNITGLMMEVFKTMYPDVADEDGKRVLWLTDWHDSRLSEEFLRAMREAGVVMIGWLPNTTSKCQLADVSLFGPFKTARERMEREWAGIEKRTVDRIAKIEIASKAMVKTMTRERIAEGARRTGMLPIDRKPLLGHPSIADGDVLHASKEMEISTAMLKQAQSLPASYPIPGSPPFIELDESPLLDTPSRLGSAEATYTSISQQQPRIGPLRSLKAALENDPDELNRVRENLLEKFDVMEAELRINAIPMYISKLKTHTAARIADADEQQEQLDKQKEQLDKQKEQLKMEKTKLALDLRIGVTQLKQENALVSKLKDETKTASAKVLCILEEKYNDLRAAKRSEFGICVESDDLSSFSIPQLQGMDVSIIERDITTAIQALRQKKKHEGAKDDDDFSSFKIGSLIHRYDEIEGTSDEIFGATSRHEKRKAEEAKVADDLAKATQAKKRQKLQSLPQRLQAAKAALYPPGSGRRNTVQNCRRFLSTLAEAEELSETQRKELRMVSALKGDELVQKTLSIAFSS